MIYPKLYRIKQELEGKRISDIRTYLHNELKIKQLATRIKPDMEIAITVGSRGIANLQQIVRVLVEWVKMQDAKPVIIPAMGSHGNAMAVGQIEVLKEYGITEEEVGAPIRSSMEVISLGTTPGGAPVFIDSIANGADGIIVLNRVKPHTTVSGPVQSGLLKMMAVGLGKQKGAESMHKYGLAENIPAAAKMILQSAKVIFGIAIIENAYEDTSDLVAIPAEEIVVKERELLKVATANLPVVPIDPLDVLVVRQMGKNISGAGMDTNVVGRWRRIGGPPDKNISRIAVFSLTEESHGNAVGVGMADFITKNIFDKIDLKATYMNAMTSGWLSGVKIPIVMDTEEEVVHSVLAPFDPREVRFAMIESTLHLENILVSEALLPEVENNSSLKILEGPLEFSFDLSGRMGALL